MSSEPEPQSDASSGSLTFTPVPRKILRHDGWTPERQRAFIAALADTGTVTGACRAVNMHPDHAYGLRRHPQGDSFRAAWDAALALAVQRLKDEAFDRALNGQLVPVFVAGKLNGYRRVKNDRLLMFCLRYYGDASSSGREVTVDYVSAKASAGAVSSYAVAAAKPAAPVRDPVALTGSSALATIDPGLAEAEAHVRTVTRRPAQRAGKPDAAAAVLAAFEGAILDDAARVEIRAALDALATRQRATMPEDDTVVSYVAVQDTHSGFAGEYEFGGDTYLTESFVPEEADWTSLGDDTLGDAMAFLDDRMGSTSQQARSAEIAEGDQRLVLEATKRLALGEIDSLPPAVTALVRAGRGTGAVDARKATKRHDRRTVRTPSFADQAPPLPPYSAGEGGHVGARPEPDRASAVVTPK